jgi:hypothetical protein
LLNAKHRTCTDIIQNCKRLFNQRSLFCRQCLAGLDKDAACKRCIAKTLARKTNRCRCTCCKSMRCWQKHHVTTSFLSPEEAKQERLIACHYSYDGEEVDSRLVCSGLGHTCLITTRRTVQQHTCYRARAHGCILLWVGSGCVFASDSSSCTCSNSHPYGKLETTILRMHVLHHSKQSCQHLRVSIAFCGWPTMQQFAPALALTKVYMHFSGIQAVCLQLTSPADIIDWGTPGESLQVSHSR